MAKIGSILSPARFEIMSTQFEKIICLSVFVFSATTACTAVADRSNVVIKNVKSGLVCTHKIDETGDYISDAHICFETEDIYVTGQGRCVFNGETKLCTWYGFEFDYNNKTNAPVPLTCHFSSDRDSVLGNPKGIKDEDFSDTEISAYEILLKPGKGHISNPQYTLLSLAGQGKTTVTLNKCEIEGQHVFDAKFNISLPVQ